MAEERRYCEEAPGRDCGRKLGEDGQPTGAHTALLRRLAQMCGSVRELARVCTHTHTHEREVPEVSQKLTIVGNRFEDPISTVNVSAHYEGNATSLRSNELMGREISYPADTPV